MTIRITPVMQSLGYAQRPAATRGPIGADSAIGWAAAALALLGSLYNALLALVNAHGTAINFALASGTEIAILGAGLGVAALAGFTRRDYPALALLFLYLVLLLYMSIGNGSFFPDAFRNMAIIAVFTMLGLRASLPAVHRMLFILATLVLAFLLLEMISTPAYVDLFQPGAYLRNSRGFQQNEWDESGLFGAVSGFAGRFTFGLSAHRTSSVFLEQVSLANFAAVLSILLLGLWRELRPGMRFYYAVIIVLIVLSNSTRTTTFLVLLSVLGFFAYPHLPRRGTLVVPALVLGLGAAATAVTGLSRGDDLSGRISITMRTLQEFDLPQILGLRAEMARHMWDSGYGYAITSGTIFGFLAFCAYVCLVLPGRTVPQRRFAYALAVYVFANMMIGGTAIFSMKTAAPLWLVAGYLMRQAPGQPDGRQTA